jgi:U3 small nucleolar RNA-associated protein 19
MDFVKLGKDGRFHSAIYHKFLHAVVACGCSFLLLLLYIFVRLGNMIKVS